MQIPACIANANPILGSRSGDRAIIMFIVRNSGLLCEKYFYCANPGVIVRYSLLLCESRSYRAIFTFIVRIPGLSCDIHFYCANPGVIVRYSLLSCESRSYRAKTYFCTCYASGLSRYQIPGRRKIQISEFL